MENRSTGAQMKNSNEIARARRAVTAKDKEPGGAGSRACRLDRPALPLYLPRPTGGPGVPRIKPAKKAMRQGRARQQRNRAQSSALRTALKRVRTATTAEQAGEAYRA